MTVTKKQRILSIIANNLSIKICFKNFQKVQILFLRKENQTFMIKLGKKLKLTKIKCGL
jgi:hypothetical protein